MHFEKIVENRVLQNALFWVFFAAVPFSLNWGSFGSLTNMYTDIQYYVECAVLGYLNNLLLMPWLFDRKRYFLYAASVMALIVFIVWISTWVTAVLSPNYPLSFLGNLYEAIDYGLFVIAFGCGYLIRSYIRQSRQISQLEEDKLHAEIDFLRSQINPHLLFNTLNTIYSYSVNNSKKTPQMILKLSDIMRYMLYETNSEKVPLEKELNYLQDYVSLQQLRIGSRGEVVFDVEGKPGKWRLAPMLLISFVENAFKYSMDSTSSKISIEIRFEIHDHTLQMTVINNYEEYPQEDKVGGIGHQNVLKRLELLYPDRHTLVIEKKENIYKVQLNLTLDE